VVRGSFLPLRPQDAVLSDRLLDGLINANPLAASLYEVFKPIAKTSINFQAGIVIDLIYGFVMAGVFLLFYQRTERNF
jgi:hypothetical protein